ncbi:MAG: hypothetical protein ACPGO5_03405 [Patescibacteria group bacterium]
MNHRFFEELFADISSEAAFLRVRDRACRMINVDPSRFPWDIFGFTPVLLRRSLAERMNAQGNGVLDVVGQDEFIRQHWAESPYPETNMIDHPGPEVLTATLDHTVVRPEKEKPWKTLMLEYHINVSGWQMFLLVLAEAWREEFPALADLSPFWRHASLDEYIKEVREVLFPEGDTEGIDVVVDVAPEKQKTRHDHFALEHYFGTPVIGFEVIRREGKRLYYRDNSTKVYIRGIHWRALPLDIEAAGAEVYERYVDFFFKNPVDVNCSPDPRWFFIGQKSSMIHTGHLDGVVPSWVVNHYFISDILPGLGGVENIIMKPTNEFGGDGLNLKPSIRDLRAATQAGNQLAQSNVQERFATPNQVGSDHFALELRQMRTGKDTTYYFGRRAMHKGDGNTMHNVGANNHVECGVCPVFFVSDEFYRKWS